MVHELAGRQTRLSTGEVANCANKMKRASSPYLLFVVAIPFWWQHHQAVNYVGLKTLQFPLSW